MHNVTCISKIGVMFLFLFLFYLFLSVEIKLQVSDHFSLLSVSKSTGVSHMCLEPHVCLTCCCITTFTTPEWLLPVQHIYTTESFFSKQTAVPHVLKLANITGLG